MIKLFILTMLMATSALAAKTALYSPKIKFTSANGTPLAGGKVYFYDAGTTTPKTTYTDAAGGTPNANPVILDANGEANIWLSGAGYKVVLKNSSDVTQWTVDNFNPAVSTEGIQDNAITTAKIQDGSITTAKIADANVTTAKIADSNITTAKIADSNVTTAKIANGAVTQAKRAALGQQVSASGISLSSVTGTTETDFSNATVTITVSGSRPVFIGLQNDLATGEEGRISSGGTTATSLTGIFRLYRDSTKIASYDLGLTVLSSTNNLSVTIPSSSLWFIDTPSAGTYTYKITGQNQSASYSSTIARSKMIAFEL